MDFDAQYRADLINIYNEKQRKDTSKDYLLPVSHKITTIALRSEQTPKVKPIPKPTTLDEDEYFTNLEQIIARDFFPQNFDKQNFEHSEKFLKMSVDEFQRRYTSEDNASFQLLHDKDRERFLKRIDFMFRQQLQMKALNYMAANSKEAHSEHLL